MVTPSAVSVSSRSTGAPLLEIQDLKVYYRTVSGIAKAVDGVNLSMGRGEILGIAGESGSGKSTLAGALLRLIRPPGYIDGGSVVLRPQGREPVDLLHVDDDTLRAVRWRHLSYIPQGSMNSLNPVMRIADQFVDVMLEHSTADRQQAHAAVPELLGQVGLGPHVARMFPHELSGGMKQRVIIAMAISLKPDLVIADEPTTALDVNVQRVMIQTLAGLRDQLGVSLIIVTHDMAVHAELVDRVAVMYAGDVVEVGNVTQVFKQPRHPYSQGLIGAIPRVGGERHRLVGIGGNAPSPRAWPSGCRFHPRCPQVMPVCRTNPPRPRQVADASAGAAGAPGMVACHLYDASGEPGR
jgi:peptide/nickel transport system ATP-binding protein